MKIWGVPVESRLARTAKRGRVHHHHGRRGRHPLRRSGLLCGHRHCSLSTSASPPAACSLTSPRRTASSPARQLFPSTMLLPPPSTQHPKFWCRSSRGDGSHQASQQLCGHLVPASAAPRRGTQTSPRTGHLRRHWRFGWPVRGLYLRS